MAYLSLEPVGYHIENYRHFVTAATVANVAPRKKGAPPLKVSDFYPARPQKANLSQRFQQQLAEFRAKRRRKRDG